LKKPYTIASIAGFLVIACSLSITLPRCAPKVRDHIAVAIAQSNMCGLFYVADGRGLFEKNRLSATVKKVHSGPPALKELEEGRADVAVTGDFAFVADGFKNGSLKVIGTIASGGGMQVIARRDSGITKPTDLIGRKVAVPKDTIGQFFLGVYCRRNGVPYHKLDIVYMPPEDVVEAIRKGTVNAACVWSPYIDRIRDYLGSDGVILPSHGRTTYYAVVVTRDDVIRERPGVLEGFLRSMIDAQTFVKGHSDEAMGIIARETGLTIDQVRRGWPENKYEVRLDQDLLTLMEAMADWMIGNHLTPKKEMPNYLRMMDPKALETVNPDAVGMVH
jgi:ABC-type nitrate/sulfonate/bicarbonate transport system substrate-binding protein